MIYLGFPYGSNFGWGVLGKEIAFAMANLAETRLVEPPNITQWLNDEIDYFRIQKILANPAGAHAMDGPVVQAAVGSGFEPFAPHLTPPFAVGFAVFEDNILTKPVVEQMRRQYHRMVAGSTYCAEVLREHGLTNVEAVLHGVNTELFCPRDSARDFLSDHFIVFSGGKFELRKGQDIVMVAYKVLQDRHRDVMLVNAWHNAWPSTRDTMQTSKLIRYFPPRDDNHSAWINALLAANGIDLNRVITVGPRDHRLLPHLYHATDLGLFPNRVEGGNNMVLMEYMACGKSVIASYNSGHKDIVRRNNAVLIESHRPMERRSDGVLTAVWNDPSVEETVDRLEWCYQNRDKLQSLARRAAQDMSQLTWKNTAAALLRLVDGALAG